MPKVVDRKVRRALIADALMRVAAEDGLLAVSVRRVAAAADVSVGMVQHYFRTKDQMMLFAVDRVSEKVQERVGRAQHELGQSVEPEVFLHILIEAMLP